MSADVTAGPDRYVQTAPAPGAPPQPVAIADISAINPAPPAWTGSIALNGLAHLRKLGGPSSSASAARCPSAGRAIASPSGPSTPSAARRTRSSGETSTTVDYAMGLAKYDHFFTKKLYGYLGTKAERDERGGSGAAAGPGAGVGYQWFEGPTFNLSNEAGLVWVYENYKRTADRASSSDHAWPTRWTGPPSSPSLLYHKLEYLPSFEDLGGDYLLNMDAGARLTVWKGLFAELRYEFRYDSTPASGRQSDGPAVHPGRGLELLTAAASTRATPRSRTSRA